MTPTEIKLPQLGESIHEGTIARWLKKPGDRVEKYEPLVEITTDKVNVEMPSPFAGVLRELLVPEGETRPVGAPIALIETADTAAPAHGPAGSDERPPQDLAASAGAAAPGVAAAPGASGAAAVAPARPRGAGPRFSPLVLRLAEEHGLPLSVLETLSGTGTGGRVTKDDVLQYVAQAGAHPPAAAAAPAAGTAAAAPPAATAPVTVPGPHDGDQVVKLTPIRRSIAQRMAQSKREIPHAYGVIEVDMGAIVAYREAHKESFRRDHGVPLTYTAFFVQAAADALRAMPAVNSSWSDEGVLLRRAVNVGVGMAVDEGLIVAVVHGADQLSLAGIARALHDLTERARAGKLTLHDVDGGTFTITNPGVFGSIWSMPIIVPGQAAILATDAIVKRAVVRDDAIAIRPIMHLGLSFDHRIFDGAASMQFLNYLKRWFEEYRGGR